MWPVSRVGLYMVWLGGVFLGFLAACVVVCAVRAVVSRWVFCFLGVPCVG